MSEKYATLNLRIGSGIMQRITSAAKSDKLPKCRIVREAIAIAIREGLRQKITILDLRDIVNDKKLNSFNIEVGELETAKERAELDGFTFTMWVSLACVRRTKPIR